jgi:DNA-binding CsgD family transcriptional regulator
MFTPREQTIARYIQDGLSNKEIAAAVGITERAIKFHVTNLFHKTGAGSRLRLAHLLLENNPGLLVPSGAEDESALRAKLTTLRQQSQTLTRQQRLVNAMITACELYLSPAPAPIANC